MWCAILRVMTPSLELPWLAVAESIPDAKQIGVLDPGSTESIQGLIVLTKPIFNFQAGDDGCF
jgi:hypothetical protein